MPRSRASRRTKSVNNDPVVNPAPAAESSSDEDASMNAPDSPSSPGEEAKIRFNIDDVNDVKNICKSLDVNLELVVQCARKHLPVLVEAGAEKKKEKKSALKKYHEVGKEVVGTKLRLEMIPQVVQHVYDDLDLEKLAEEEEDDEQFMALLEEFEQKVTAEVEAKWAEVDDDAIDKEDDYQECLEVLNEFVDRGSNRASKAARNSEGIEALSEYVPTIDPITKKLFTDPYVNQLCGHVYEFSSIVGYMRNGGTRCPYTGCNNGEALIMGDIGKDKEVEKKIMERIRLEAEVD